MIIRNGSYVWFCAGQTEREGIVTSIKPLPHQMIAYQIDGQWYSDPHFIPINQEVQPTIAKSSTIVQVQKTIIELQPIVQLCGGFSNRKIHSLWLTDAPLHVLKHIFNCNLWDSISPKELSDILHELILYGYEVRILAAKKETIPPIEWIEQ